MKRKTFIRNSALFSLGMVSIAGFRKFSESLSEQDLKMPLLFVGHGSPMNAIEDNEFSRGWKTMSANLPKPNAVICVSAHWETRGTKITAMDQPKTIHDFGGFPQELFNVQYPALGNPDLAKEAADLIKTSHVDLDHQWGLDHGCWSVVKNMYPDADIPVLQLSLDSTQAPQYHYDLAKELAALRKKGVLILGSGNIVHNLGMVDWNHLETGYDWAVELNEKIKTKILDGDHQSLIDYSSLGKEANWAIPSNEHYLPLLYILGLKEEKENISFFNDKAVMGSITMTSVQIS